MYYQNYEDYMRLVLGYQINEQDTYTYENIIQLEEYYPKIYKILKPIVEDVCKKYKKNIEIQIENKEIENMVEEVIRRLEINNEMYNKENNYSMRNNNTNRQFQSYMPVNNQLNNQSNNQSNNQILRDLIKILIITRLLNAI